MLLVQARIFKNRSHQLLRRKTIRGNVFGELTLVSEVLNQRIPFKVNYQDQDLTRT